MKNNTTKGVSVIICCYNSSKRLKKTLDALLKQECNSAIDWEIIIVDNKSTDGTADIAEAIWIDAASKINLRIVKEPVAGLSHARKKGVSVAAYSILIFCDDDNWLAPNYVQDVYELMQQDPNVAACGGMGIPVFEGEEPFWFYMYSESFALGTQEINSENGRILNLYGAGLAVRKQVLEAFYNSGYKSILTGRTATKLSSAEDTEITYAFVLLGYKLIYSEELKFFHFLPKERLTFTYLKKLIASFGNDGPVRNLYYANITERYFHKKITIWIYHFLLSLYRLIKYFILPPKKYGRIIYLNWNRAYISQLWRMRKNYRQLNNKIASLKNAGNIERPQAISPVRLFSVPNENEN